MTISVAKEVNASAGNNGACSNGGSGKDECNSSERARGGTKYGDSSKTGPICNGSGLREELLCLWGFRAHGLLLQKQRKRKTNRRKEDGV